MLAVYPCPKPTWNTDISSEPAIRERRTDLENVLRDKGDGKQVVGVGGDTACGRHAIIDNSMKTTLAVLSALSLFVIAPTRAADAVAAKDIGAPEESPLAAAARDAGRAEAKSGEAGQSADKKPTDTQSAQAQSTQGPEAEKGGSTEQRRTPLLPQLPQSAQKRVSQIGGLEIAFEATPLEDAVRQLSPQLGRPVNLSVQHVYYVTGSWRDEPSIEILREITGTYGLILRETPAAYIIEETGRQIGVPAAKMRPEPQRVTATPLEPVTYETPITYVKPLSPKDQLREFAKLKKEAAAALREREELKQQAGH